jgi:flagellar export protein FliJ
MRGPLRILIEMAERGRARAARALAGELAALRTTQGRGELLERYYADYLARAEQRARAGIEGGTLRDLKRFIARIDDAHAQQAREHAALEQRVAAARSEWNEAERRLQAFRALARRREALAEARERRAEQRQQDELSARRIPGHLDSHANDDR